MKSILALSLLMLWGTSCLHRTVKDECLTMFCDSVDETMCGYVNCDGDTIIPLGKYSYCYTDTLINYAIVLDKSGKLKAIDRAGKELFEVLWYDNGPDYLSDGLFRIVKNGKIGYANAKAQIVIEPRFDCAFPFKDGKAKVSNNCQIIQESEYVMWKSDSWFYIDKKGKRINSVAGDISR